MSLPKQSIRKIVDVLKHKSFLAAAGILTSSSWAVALFLFNQGDLNHTVVSSYAILRGHFLDFYSFNTQVVGFNDYFPALYAVFAAWMAPAYFAFQAPLGLSIPVLGSAEIIWAKLLLSGLFIWSAFCINQIVYFFSKSKKKSEIATLLFLTSPIALFAFDAFSQYDIIEIAVALTAVWILIKSKNKTFFALIFGLSFSLKFFTAIYFIPVLLAFFPSWRTRVYLCFIFVTPTIFQVLIFWHDPAFSSRAFQIVFGKASGALGNPIAIACIIASLAVMAFAAFRKNETVFDRSKSAVIDTSMLLALFFIATAWHPQWLILIIPVWSMLATFYKQPLKLLLIEIALFVIFIFLAVSEWPGNVDSYMIKQGPLQAIFDDPKFLIADILPKGLVSSARIIFDALLLSPLFLLWLEGEKDKHRYFDSGWARAGIFARIAAMPLFFSIPAVSTFLVPTDLARAFSPMATSTLFENANLNIKPETTVGELVSGSQVRQSFQVPEGRSLKVFAILFANYGRSTNGNLQIRITDNVGKLVFLKNQNTNELLNNSWKYFELNGNTRSGEFILSIHATEGEPMSSPTIWASKDDTYTKGMATIGNNPIPGDISLKIFLD